MPLTAVSLRFFARRPTPHRRGWLLVALIVLLSAVIVALAGATFFLTEHLRALSVRQNQTRAVYLAQAGLMQALYDFRQDNGIVLREYNVDNPSGAVGPNDDVFILQALGMGHNRRDFLLVNMRANVQVGTQKYCGTQRDRLQGWSLRNPLASEALEIIAVGVTTNTGAGMLRLDLDGTGADWQAPGCVPQPTVNLVAAGVPASQRTLQPGDRWGTNRVWFSTSGGLSRVDLTFTLAADLAGNNIRTARWDLLDTNQRTADMTLTSVGEVREGRFPFTQWRRLQVEYRLCTTALGTQCNTRGEEAQRPGVIRAYRELMVRTP